jgi:hypothetical protein
LFRGAIEQRAALSFGSFLFAAEKKRTPAQDTKLKKTHKQPEATPKFHNNL